MRSEDFEDERLRSVFEVLAPLLASGGPVDVSAIEDPGTREVAMSLLLDDAPLPEMSDVENLLKLRRLETRIDAVEAKMEELEQGSETHSAAFRELIALQQERRSLGIS